MKEIRKIKKILPNMCSEDIRIIIDECIRELTKKVRAEYVMNRLMAMKLHPMLIADKKRYKVEDFMGGD